MSEDDTKARKERAARLRRQIDRMLKPDAGSSKPPAPRSVRDFIHDKMAEDAGHKKR